MWPRARSGSSHSTRAATRAPSSVPNRGHRRAGPGKRAPRRDARRPPRRAAPARYARARLSLPGKSDRSPRARAGSAGPSLFRALADGATEGDLPVIDADVEPAFGIRADPGLVCDRRPVAAVVRQRDEKTVLTFPAGGPLSDIVHAPPPSPDPAPLSALHAGPWIAGPELRCEIVHVLEVFGLVGRLAREQPHVDQREHDLSEVFGAGDTPVTEDGRSEEHTSELQSHSDLVCRLLLEKKKKQERR